MGKGSNRRREDIAKIWDNWDQIFGKKDKKEQPKDIKEESKTTQDASKENAK